MAARDNGMGAVFPMTFLYFEGYGILRHFCRVSRHGRGAVAVHGSYGGILALYFSFFKIFWAWSIFKYEPLLKNVNLLHGRALFYERESSQSENPKPGKH